MLCSNDPVCAQHDAASRHERRFLHGAACHGCLLISETSCEQQNDFLDRALVVPTVQDLGEAFFSEIVASERSNSEACSPTTRSRLNAEYGGNRRPLRTEVAMARNSDGANERSQLFRSTERSVLIAGYAVHQGQRVFQALGNRMAQHPELDVQMFLYVPRKRGDTSSTKVLIARLVQEFKNSHWPKNVPLPMVYVCEQLLLAASPGSLHAKCIVVDSQQVFVSSANFTEAAQLRNIEVGLLVNSSAIGERVRRFFRALVDNGFFIRAI
jgi:hypothetical protein